MAESDSDVDDDDRFVVPSVDDVGFVFPRALAQQGETSSARQQSCNETLMPLVKELACLLDLNYNPDMQSKHVAILYGMIAEAKGLLRRKEPQHRRFVSSSVPSRKRQKTHGTKHM